MGSKRSSFIPILFICLGLLATRGAAQDEQGSRLQLSYRGHSLGKVLVELSSSSKHPHRADPALARQRVTVLVSRMQAAAIRSAIAELLQAGADETVNWRGDDRAGWVLTESLNRKRRATALRNHDLDAIAKQLAREAEWLGRDAPAELEQAKRDDPRLRLIVEGRITLASYFDSLAPDRLRAFLNGTPLSLRVGDLEDPLRVLFRSYLQTRSGHLRDATHDELDRCGFVFVLARSPTDPLGARVIESRLDPQRGVWARLSTPIRVPHIIRVPALEPVFDLPPPDTADTSPRVSLNLSPHETAKPGQILMRGFDETLAAIAAETRINIVADGYLRGPTRFPAQLRVVGYPLHQLLNRLCEVWSCEWKISQHDRSTVLIRARNWWMEDEADVPGHQVEEFKRAFGSGKSPELPDLLRFAELTNAQAHKLLESGLCPGAYGVVKPLWYDTLGAKPCLRFFQRLSPQMQAAAQSGDGLSLGSVTPSLVNAWLGPTLLAEVGVMTPEAVAALNFRVSRLGEGEPGTRGYRVELFRPDLLGPRWRADIRPLSRMP